MQHFLTILKIIARDPNLCAMKSDKPFQFFTEIRPYFWHGTVPHTVITFPFTGYSAVETDLKENLHHRLLLHHRYKVKKYRTVNDINYFMDAHHLLIPNSIHNYYSLDPASTQFLEEIELIDSSSVELNDLSYESEPDSCNLLIFRKPQQSRCPQLRLN